MNHPQMSLYDHLIELRSRILVTLIVVSFVAIIFYFQVPGIIGWLLKPVTGFKLQLVYFSITEGFTTRVKLAVFVAIVLLSPLIFYQVAAFVNPGLTTREKQIIYRSLVWISFGFIGGVIFGFFELMPRVFKFLILFGKHYMNPVFSANTYFSFIVMFCLVVGGFFTIPGIMILLGKLRIMNARLMMKGRKYVILGAVGLGSMIAPMTDFLTFFLLALPIVLLYEVMLWVTFWREKWGKKTI